ncbi:RNA-directed DNA polymerase, eukaryota, reverse transcriptase zinc-binding domain protein [Tanacetum coccineum]|uniref:RNA-directed DNA polymerase, eukaryota, reverse transcriptase zinc-binding domain protein n=1 Tax=Tanacetum coccineum TaxID=301880 RepID=A0ABQ4X9Z9_9ASTR
MSMFKVPKCVSNKMEAFRRNFFNGVEGSGSKVNWVGWKHVLASMEKGGLGVSSFFALNRTLLFKWVWRYISQIPSLWTRFITAIHGSCRAVEGTSSTSRNSLWLDIIKALSSLKTKGIDLLGFAKKKVGNGEKTLFWDDLWIGEDVLKSQFPRLFALELQKDISVAKKMSHSSLAFFFRRMPRGGVEEEQFNNLNSCTSAFILPQIEDRWVWSLSSTGDFSGNSARSFIDDKLLPNFDSPTRWVKVIPIKINIFAWRVWQDKLPTRLNLSLRGIDIPTILCSSCNTSVESTSHLFFSCPVARQVWSKVLRWWELTDSRCNTYYDWFNWLNNSQMSKGIKDIFEGVCYVTWWTLWRFRNQCVFGKSQPRKESLFDDIAQMSFTWCASRCKSNFTWNSWLKNPRYISL